MNITDDDVKTRGQKERLEQISTEVTNGDVEDKPSLKKEGTMAVTARVRVTD